MTERLDTVVVGAGQAGLSISYYLNRQGRPHLVLEQAGQIGSAWRKLWDSFTLVTPNWHIALPGAPYEGGDPDGFMPGDGYVAYLQSYAKRFGLPVRCGVRVETVEAGARGGYTLESTAGTWEATHIVVATGSFQHTTILPCHAGLPPEVAQLTSDRYRNPAALPDGAVLVVGSAMSGCQIAEELYQSGRQVYLCVGHAGRVPRRYRGRDITWWLERMGWHDHTLADVPSRQARLAPRPHLSGTKGGHTLNLHQFARDGVVLLGRLLAAQEGKVVLAGDLDENLAYADRFEAERVSAIDAFIERAHLDAPREVLPVLSDGYNVPLIRELDLRSAKIGSVIWAVGYTADYSLVRPPIVDEYGYPIHDGGVTARPGLYFLGLDWLRTRNSAGPLGVGNDAAFIAAHLEAQE